jgi:hypothetical protein
LWLKIIIEIVLTLLVMFFGCGFWVFLCVPSSFERQIGDRKRISISTEAIRKSGLGFKKGYLEARESEEFEAILTSCNSNAFKVWAIEKWSCLTVVIALLFGSFFLHWSWLLVNLLVFLLMFAFSLVAGALASKQIALDAQIIQQWRVMDSTGCEKFCTETNPKFATVFRVASTTGGEPAI